MYRNLLATLLVLCLCWGAQNLTAQTTYYVNDADLTNDALTSAVGDDANPGSASLPFLTLSHAIGQASDSDIILVDAGTYGISSTLDVNKELTIEGLSESLVIIDATGLSPYSLRAIETDADNVTLRNFTILPAVDPGPGKAGFTVKAGSNSLPTINSNLTLENITVDGAERTPFDIHGIDNVTITNLTANNTSGGNGIQLTGVSGAVINSFTGTNNAWGSIAIYTSRPFDRGSDNIVIDGAGLNIDGNVYSQDDFGDLNPSYSTDLMNSNISVTGWDFVVYNDDFRSGGDGPEYDFFYDTEADAVAGATDLNSQNGGNTGSIIFNLNATVWVVGGTGFSIQAAIDVASDNDVITVLDGSYPERVVIDKPLTLSGETESGTIVEGSSFPNGRGIAINSGVADVTIESLTVQNFSGSNGNTHAGIYAIGGNNNLVIQSVTIQDNVGGSGFYANGPVDNVLVDDVTSSGHTSSARGIVIWNGLKSNVTISNCEVFNNNCCGIELQDGNATGVSLINNNVYNNGDNGIGIVGMEGPGENLVSGNTLQDNGRFGIEIKNPNGSGTASGAGSIVIENNNVSRTAAIGDARDIVGIAVFRRGVLATNVDVPTGAVVQNNTVSGYTQTSDSDGFGIVVEGVNHTVTGNNVSGCDVGIQQQAGHLPYPGDGNQNNIADEYFGRGNSPVTCGISISGNTLSNTVDTRNVPSSLASAGIVTNANTGNTYCTIQEAIDDATAGDVIEVAAGIYAENLVIEKSIDLRGPNYSVSPISGTRAAEAIITTAIADVWAVLIDVNADDVSVRGFTLDGDNTSLTSGYTNTTAADIDAGEAITAYYAGTDRLIVRENIIQNLNYSAVSIYPYYPGPSSEGAGTPSAGHEVIDNVIQDLGTYDSTSGADYWGMATLLYNNAYAAIENNSILNVRLAVQTGNFYQATPDAGFNHGIRNNEISTRRRGVFHNLAYSSASSIPVENNTITAIDESNESDWDGILLSSMSVAHSAENNSIDGSGTTVNSQGIEIWNVDASTPSQISGGSISNVDTGIFVNNFEGYNSNAGDGAHADVSNVDVSVNASGVGAHVLDSPSSTTNAPVVLNLVNSTLVGGAVSVLIEGGSAAGTFSENSFSGQDGLAIDASGYTGPTALTASCNWFDTADFIAAQALVAGNVTNDEILNDGTDTDAPTAGFQPDPLACLTVVVGCTDADACNYDSLANAEDNSCDYSCYGCTDAGSPDYDPAATLDDGSCDLCSTDEPFDDALTLAATQTADAWYVDRYAPSGFIAPTSFLGDNRLRQFIFALDGGLNRPSGFSSSFYNTQGRKYDLPEITTGISVDLYVPSDWATTGRRMAGFWGTGFNASDNISAYPIIEFTSDDNETGTGTPEPRFRMYNNGVWVDMGLPTGFTYDSWVTLEIQKTANGEFLCTVGDLAELTTTLEVENSEYIGNVILQGHNTEAGVTYAIHWDNLSYLTECGGCTDPLALNYDPIATVDDGSCQYPAPSYTDLSVEVYAVDGVTGFTTYRVFANFSNEYDELTAVYGVVDMTQNAPLSFTTTGTFYQDPNGSYTSNNILPGLFTTFPELEYDSYLALGAPTGPNFLLDTGLTASSFDTNGMQLNDDTGGAWYVIPGTEPEAFAGPDGKVMIGQFTTDGIADLLLNLQYKAQDGTINTLIGESISFPDDIFGCTDGAACNYNPLATSDDSSCVFPGCQDDEACNYDPLAGCAATCDYSCLTEYFVNDGNLTDDVYTNAIGNDANPGTPSAPFATIAHAIAQANVGSTIYVDAGSYVANVSVNKSLDIRGANYGVSPNGGVRAAESIVYPETSNELGEMFSVEVSDVSIDGFTIDGDNPALTSGINNPSGADLDAAEAVTVYFDNVNNLHVSNNIISNLTYFAVTVFGGSYSAPTSSGHVIENNLISSMGTYDGASSVAFWGGGVLIYNDQYTRISNNVMTDVRIGVQTGNFHDPNTGDAQYQLIENNEIEARRRGVFYNLHTGNASSLTLSNNTITALADANETVWDGILMASLSDATGYAIDNTIDGSGVATPSEGIEIWNVDAAFPAEITGGSISNVDIGVFANNFEGYSSDASDGAHALVSDLSISVNAGGYGVRVLDSPSSTSHASVEVTVSNSFLSNGETAVSIEGESSYATISENSFSGQTGLAIDASLYTGVTAISAICNWYDTPDYATAQALIDGNVDGDQILTDGTDTDVAQGFQPDGAACTLFTAGCTDANACNYDMGANYNDGSCDYACYGCTDMSASNYDASATIDDGSCDLCPTIEPFEDPITIGASQAADTWYTDRYAPTVFSAPTVFDGDDRLRQVIFEFDGGQYRPSGFESAFYNTQGRKYDLPEGALSMSVELYVPSDWATSGRRMAGFWGTAFDASDAVSGYPIIEFTSDDNESGTGTPEPRFRAYNNGEWIDMGLPSGFTYDTWVTLEMSLVPSTGEFIFNVGDLNTATTTLSSNASENIGNVILQGHNTDDGVTYSIHWDNFKFSVVPNGCTDPSACNFDPSATCDDGSCILPDGCTDATACNYNPTAVCDDSSCEYTSCVGCTDPFADNYDAANTVEDGSCTYCATSLSYNVTGPDPITIGSGISNEYMATAEDCNVSASIKAIERFSGDIIPTGGLYRIESGESPISGGDPTPDPGMAKWNYVLSVNLGTYTANEASVYLDVDFNPDVAPGAVYTVDISQFLIDNGLGGTSLIQDSQNLGFDFWQLIGDPAITVFDPFANGIYDLTLRVVSPLGQELANAPIQVEVFTPGCTDPLAENYNANANEEDASCTYCASNLTYDTTAPDPISVGSGLSNQHMALSEDCNVSAAIKAHLRFNGDIVPTVDQYLAETGESPTSGVDPTPAAGLAKWNYLVSVNLGAYTFNDVEVLLDLDFDPAVASGAVYTADLSQFMIDNGFGATSTYQDSQNLGFAFWQSIGDPAITGFDPFANGRYDLAIRVVSPAGVELVNAPIYVETFTEGCTDMTACNYNADATVDDSSCVYGDTWYLDNDNDGFGDMLMTTVACTQPAGYVADNTDCDDSNEDMYPGAPSTFEGIDNNCNGVVDVEEQLPCMGDFNDDGLRNTSDLLILLGDFGCNSGCIADLSGDDVVNASDLLAFLGIFGLPCP